MRERLSQLLDSDEHRPQALELLHALNDPELWDLALARVPVEGTTWRNEGVDEVPAAWWSVVAGAPPEQLGALSERVERLMVRNLELEELPFTPRELLLEACVVRTLPSALERLVLIGCQVECALPVVAELELYWPTTWVHIPDGCGHVVLTGDLSHYSELDLRCERLTVLWGHALRHLRTSAERVELVDCERLEALDAGGELSVLRARGRRDHFARRDEALDEENILASLHRSMGHSWPRFVAYGPRLCQLGARWVGDWSDTDAILLEKQGPWEDLLAAFRDYPEAPMAAAESYIAVFGRSRARAERFLNRVFHNPWGLNERTFMHRGESALAWLAEHPRCLQRELVKAALERTRGP